MKKITKLFDPKWWLYDFIKWSGFGVIKLFYRNKNIYINGKKPKGLFKDRLIICSNHVSFKDAAGITSSIWSRRIAFIVGQQLLDTHKARFWFKVTKCIGVDSQSLNIESFKKVVEVIDRGHSVTFFPEGHISETDDLLPFKPGAIMCAFLAKADILPVYICKREKNIKRWVIVYGERIKINELFKNEFPSIDEINNACAYLNQKVNELKLIYLDRWVNRKSK